MNKALLPALLLSALEGFQAPSQEPPAPWSERVPIPPEALPGLVFLNAKGVLEAPGSWDSQDWKRAGLGAAAVLGAALALDRPLRKTFEGTEHPVRDRWANRISSLGAVGSVATAGTFYLAGLWGAGPRAQATGADALSASLITSALLVPALKFVTSRSRPEQGHGVFFFKPFTRADGSFPSGHTAQAFAVAAVIASHDPENGVQALAYGGAALVGVSRIAGRFHHASDVVAGALLGFWTGKAVVGLNRPQTLPGGFNLAFTPRIGLDGSMGIQVKLRF